MSVAPVLKIIDTSWRIPGCGEQCRTYDVRFPNRSYTETIACHDALSHEAYGLHSVARAYSPVNGRVVRTGGITIDGTTAAVLVDGRLAKLTPIELRIIFYLAQNIGRVCHPHEILRAVWGEEYAPKSEHTSRSVRGIRASVAPLHMLRINVSRIRPKLGAYHRLLVTHPGMGYRLLVEAPRETEL